MASLIPQHSRLVPFQMSIGLFHQFLEDTSHSVFRSTAIIQSWGGGLGPLKIVAASPVRRSPHSPVSRLPPSGTRYFVSRNDIFGAHDVAPSN